MKGSDPLITEAMRPVPSEVAAGHFYALEVSGGLDGRGGWDGMVWFGVFWMRSGGGVSDVCILCCSNYDLVLLFLLVISSYCC